MFRGIAACCNVLVRELTFREIALYALKTRKTGKLFAEVRSPKRAFHRAVNPAEREHELIPFAARNIENFRLEKFFNVLIEYSLWPSIYGETGEREIRRDGTRKIFALCSIRGKYINVKRNAGTQTKMEFLPGIGKIEARVLAETHCLERIGV